MNDILDLKVTDIKQLSARIQKCFRIEGIITLRDVMKENNMELKRIPNFGEVSLQQLQKCLKEYGLKLPYISKEKYWNKLRKEYDRL